MAATPDHPAYTLLSRAQPAELASSTFKEKVQHRPLILRPTSPDPLSKDARGARRRERLRKHAYKLKKQKPKRLSAKERRKLGIHEVPQDPAMRKWELYVPLRRMWWGYMQELLGVEPAPSVQDGADGNVEHGGIRYVTGVAVGPKLASADYHGAEIEVVRSHCVSRVGVRGIVLKDTQFTFEIITRNNEIKTIPKKQTVFRFKVPRSDLGPMPTETEPGTALSYPKCESEIDAPRAFVFELHGSQFEFKAVDRANRKFKTKRMDDL